MCRWLKILVFRDIVQKIKVLSLCLKISYYFAINNIKMNFCFPIVFVYNPNISQVQIIQVPPQSLHENTYQASNILSYSSQAKQHNPTILSSNITTQDSLTARPAQQAPPKKKKLPIKKERDQNFGWRIQNKDRNIMSNILKAFVNYVHDEQETKTYIQKIAAKFDLQNNVSDFYIFFKHHFPLTQSYISSKSLKAFLKDKEHPQSLLLILRLVINHFFRVDFPLILLKSTKIKRKSKLQQMKRGRQLLQTLFRQ